MTRHTLSRTLYLRTCGLLATLLVLAGFAARARADGGDAWSPQPYHLGQGLYFPRQQLRLGGYANLHLYALNDRPKALMVHDMSVFVTKKLGSRWELFNETEVSDALSLTNHRATHSAAEVDIERLYLDYHARPGVTLRLGKYLTPVGQWNLIHADPLVWTISRPLTTTAAFSRHATGAMVYGTFQVHHDDLDYWLFADDSRLLAPGPDRDLAFSAYGTTSTLHNNFNHALGGQVLYHMLDERFSIGLSVLRYQLETPRRNYRLLGMDFAWNGRRFDLSGEAVLRKAGGTSHGDQHGGYLQAVIPLRSRLFLVLREEHYVLSNPRTTTELHVLALNYRPFAGLTFKLERRDGRHSDPFAPSGWMASMAVLF